MKKLVVVALALMLVASLSYAQKMSIGVAADVLIPTGDFGNAYSLGFGGSAHGQYDFTPMIAGGLNIGYYTWSAKSVPAGIEAPTFHGLPVRVYGKYYFMPAGKLRVYGMAELGLFFWSSTVNIPAIVTPFGTFGGGSTSTTGSDFNLVPEVGIELPAGNLTIDAALQYDIILTSGSSTANIGIRAGVNFPIGM